MTELKSVPTPKNDAREPLVMVAISDDHMIITEDISELRTFVEKYFSIAATATQPLSGNHAD